MLNQILLSSLNQYHFIRSLFHAIGWHDMKGPDRLPDKVPLFVPLKSFTTALFLGLQTYFWCSPDRFCSTSSHQPFCSFCLEWPSSATYVYIPSPAHPSWPAMILNTGDTEHRWCHTQAMPHTDDARHRWCHAEVMPCTSNALHRWCCSQVMRCPTQALPHTGAAPLRWCCLQRALPCLLLSLFCTTLCHNPFHAAFLPDYVSQSNLEKIWKSLKVFKMCTNNLGFKAVLTFW